VEIPFKVTCDECGKDCLEIGGQGGVKDSGEKWAICGECLEKGVAIPFPENDNG
jgi:hypothetical protein